VVNAAVGLLRTCFEQVKKLFVVAEKFADGEHDASVVAVVVRRG